MGVSPEDIYFNVWSKADVSTGKAGSLVSMEKAGNASYKLTKKANQLHNIDKFQNVMQAFIKKYKADA